MRRLMRGALNSSPEWYHPRRGLGAKELGSQFAAVFLEGLATQRKPHRYKEPSRIIAKNSNATLNGSAKQLEGGSTRKRILDAAAVVLRHNGLSGTRLADVANEAGMQAGSLYYHFTGRDELIEELLHLCWEHTTTLVTTQLDALPANASHLERISTLIRAHLNGCLENGSYTSALVRILGQLPEDVRKLTVAMERQYSAIWRRVLKEAGDAKAVRTDLDLSAIVMMLMGALNWSFEWYRADGAASPDDIADQFADLILFGWLNPESNSEWRPLGA